VDLQWLAAGDAGDLADAVGLDAIGHADARRRRGDLALVAEGAGFEPAMDVLAACRGAVAQDLFFFFWLVL